MLQDKQVVLGKGVWVGLGVLGERGRRGRGWLLLWPGFLVDVREDVDLVEAEAELAQQRDDPTRGKWTHFFQKSHSRPGRELPWQKPPPPSSVCTWFFSHSKIPLIFGGARQSSQVGAHRSHYGKVWGAWGGEAAPATHPWGEQRWPGG